MTNGFEQRIYEKRDSFYKKFAEEFFNDQFWKKVLDEDVPVCAMLCQFYKVIKFRCDLNDNETSKIAYESLKKKCLGETDYDDFKKILDKNLNKLGGFKSFFNSEIKTSMNAFHRLYLAWETKMVVEGYIS